MTDRAAEAERRIRAIVGPAHCLTAPEDMAPYLREWRGLYQGAARLVARPATTEEVAAVVRVCAELGLGVVPQGGGTGLVGGSTAYDAEREIVLSLQRLDRIRDIDPIDYAMTLEAGVILKTAQEAAEAVDRLFPLSLGSEGSCRIGGNLSSNAGGLNTVRYGNARDLTLGLEVVLADGRVWNGLNALRKNNAGYDLKHLFIGGEGTLGIVTAATVKLFPRPRQKETAYVAVPDPSAAIRLFAELRAASGDAVSAFELMPRIGVDFALRHTPGLVDPLRERHPWHALAELTSSRPGTDLRAALEATLADALERGDAADAVLAESEAQAANLWRIREGLVEGQRHEGASIKHDVSVPTSRVPAFLAEATPAVERAIPGLRVVAFGHVGDGNVHFNLSQPVGADPAAFLARWEEMNAIVFDVCLRLGGSISAEHGIGRLKRGDLRRAKPAVEIEMMERVKAALDPAGLMNPGKLL